MLSYTSFFLLEFGFPRYHTSTLQWNLTIDLFWCHAKLTKPLCAIKLVQESSRITRSRSFMPIDEQSIMYCTDVTLALSSSLDNLLQNLD
jgi:hypothetical protein